MLALSVRVSEDGPRCSEGPTHLDTPAPGATRPGGRPHQRGAARPVTAGSEGRVRDLIGELRRETFEQGVQMWIDASEAAFPPYQWIRRPGKYGVLTANGLNPPAIQPDRTSRESGCFFPPLAVRLTLIARRDPALDFTTLPSHLSHAASLRCGLPGIAHRETAGDSPQRDS